MGPVHANAFMAWYDLVHYLAQARIAVPKSGSGRQVLSQTSSSPRLSFTACRSFCLHPR